MIFFFWDAALIKKKKDIENRNINFIGNPEQRINEDPVRLLRAIRFHAKLEFNLGLTLGNIKKFIPLLDNIPYSRIFDEMMKFFLTGHAKKSIFVLKEYQLLDLFFPFLSNHSLDKNIWICFIKEMFNLGI